MAEGVIGAFPSMQARRYANCPVRFARPARSNFVALGSGDAMIVKKEIAMDNLEQAKKSLWRAQDATSPDERQQHLAAGIEFLEMAIEERSEHAALS